MLPSIPDDTEEEVAPPEPKRAKTTDNEFEDEIDADPLGNSFTAKFPNIPRTRCPSRLFINTLRPKYLDSLYSTDRESFPGGWSGLKRNQPEFLNNRWTSQGLNVTPGETIIDLYNFHELKHATVATIKETMVPISESSSIGNQPCQDKSQPSETESRLDRSVTRLEETVRIITSSTVKLTGREVSGPVSNIVPTPRLVGDYIPTPPLRARSPS